MAIYNIEYNSANTYEEEVTEAIFQLLISPCNDQSQQLLDFQLKNSIHQPAFHSKNSFGFETIKIRPEKPFKTFEINYKARVEKKEFTFNEKAIKPKQQWETLTSPHFYIENFLYLNKTSLTKIGEENKNQILELEANQDIKEFLIRVNEFVHFLLLYQQFATTIETTADEVLALKKGVCQDYTHLFIAIARENKIPSRYVAGYLDQGENYIGTSMMHAWVEALIPGTGWIGFDPTNNNIVNDKYIKVCHGIDYSDCSPLKGVLLTKGSNTTHHQVKVAQQ